MNCVTPPRRSVSRTRCHWCFGQTKLSRRSLSLESPRLLEGPAYGGPDGMPVEFNVTLQDRPGTLARLGQMLGEAAVNIEAIQGMSREVTALSTSFPEILSRLLGFSTRLGLDTVSGRYLSSRYWTSRAC